MTAPAPPSLAEMSAAVLRAHDRQVAICDGHAVAATLKPEEERRLILCLARAAATIDTVEKHADAIRALLALPPRIRDAVKGGARGLAELYGGDPAGGVG